MNASWKRTPYGYWSPDGTAYIERGGEMEGLRGGLTNQHAWLVWVAVPDEWVETYRLDDEDDATAAHAIYAGPGRFAGTLGAAVPFAVESPEAGTYRARRDGERYYVHTNDEGWLGDAKQTVAIVQAALAVKVAS